MMEFAHFALLHSWNQNSVMVDFTPMSIRCLTRKMAVQAHCKSRSFMKVKEDL